MLQTILTALPPSADRNLPQTYFAVPGHGATRWLLPDIRNIGGVLDHWTPYRLSSQIKWAAIKRAYGAGLMGAVPGVQRLSAGDICYGIDWRALGWTGNYPPIPLIYIGTPGPSQKAVIHLVDPLTRAANVVVKVPLNPSAVPAVLHEADVLFLLDGEDYVCCPRLICTDFDRAVTAQSFSPGVSGQRQLRPLYLHLLRALMLFDERTSLFEQANSWIDEFGPALTENSSLDEVRRALDELSDHRDLPACWLHGDFAPWNIRDLADAPPALIDWEDAERGGLPLFDAFHFLHAQDFLFGARPALHWPELEGLARMLGITAALSRKLEIAYLVRTYLQSIGRADFPRAAFLLQCVGMILSDVPKSRSLPAKCGPQLVRPRGGSAHARAQLLASVVRTFNSAGLHYCVLSGYDAGPASESDVDIMFDPGDLQRVPALLTQAARSENAVLAQAIQHETSATYFVVARADEAEPAHLAVDCYGDYVRDRRTWLRAEPVVFNRRSCRQFSVPAVADEFTYYLIKKVLKRSISSCQLKALQHLFARNPSECRRGITAIFPPSSAAALERAIVSQDLQALKNNSGRLLAELQMSPHVIGLFERWRLRVHEVARRISRVLRPTGMHIAVIGSDAARCRDLADILQSKLHCLFRRTVVLQAGKTVPERLRTSFRAALGRIYSTLVISTVVDSQLLPPDLILRVDGRTEAERKDSRAIWLDSSRSDDELIAAATNAVLGYMSGRIATRLKLRDNTATAPSYEPANKIEFEAAGTD